MRKCNDATHDQLKELYQAASEFAQAQPWKEFWDADIICIENPKDKSTGYCSIMGRAGEHYALGVYLGNQGIHGFNYLMTHIDSIPSHQKLHYQNCLMCSFEDREFLSVEDRKQIKDLGLSYRGRNAWPLFRRYEPGYHPWYISKEECILLTHALKQTLLTVGDILAGRIKIDMERGRTVLRYSRVKGNQMEWFSKEIQLAYPVASYRPIKINDDILLQKIKAAGSMENTSLQADILYMPSAIQDNKGERPYYPRLFILAEQKSGQILDYNMFQSVNNDANVVIHRLADICLKYGIPKEIIIRNDIMKAILGDFCLKTGIGIKVAKKLSAVDRMMKGMASRF